MYWMTIDWFAQTVFFCLTTARACQWKCIEPRSTSLSGYLTQPLFLISIILSPITLTRQAAFCTIITDRLSSPLLRYCWCNTYKTNCSQAQMEVQYLPQQTKTEFVMWYHHESLVEIVIVIVIVQHKLAHCHTEELNTILFWNFCTIVPTSYK